jgi:hypothetical protein
MLGATAAFQSSARNTGGIRRGRGREGELRCRVKWPEDEERVATLTALFFHIPEDSARGPNWA